MFLGFEVYREGQLGTIMLSQSQYIENLLQRHCIKDCIAAANPLDAAFQCKCDKEVLMLMDAKESMSRKQQNSCGWRYHQGETFYLQCLDRRSVTRIPTVSTGHE